MRVVTIGGGHGQAALLSALVRLQCDITAVVSVADDGGCSGRLRAELGIAPPGDIRRCLSALARHRALAERFESRLDGDMQGRCAGNLVLSQMSTQLGGLQAAVDWAASLLACRGRVVPVAEVPGTLAVYDAYAGAVEGETNVERQVSIPLVASVHGPVRANPVALDAIAQADLVFIGPGSFVTSVLATLSTADVASALSSARASCVLVANLQPEGKVLQHFTADDYVRLLRNHIAIHSFGGTIDLSVLQHGEGCHTRSAFADGMPDLRSPLAVAHSGAHDPALLSQALQHHFGLAPAIYSGANADTKADEAAYWVAKPPVPAAPSPEEAERRFSACLDKILDRLRDRSLPHSA